MLLTVCLPALPSVQQTMRYNLPLHRRCCNHLPSEVNGNVIPRHHTKWSPSDLQASNNNQAHQPAPATSPVQSEIYEQRQQRRETTTSGYGTGELGVTRSAAQQQYNGDRKLVAWLTRAHFVKKNPLFSFFSLALLGHKKYMYTNLFIQLTPCHT